MPLGSEGPTCSFDRRPYLVFDINIMIEQKLYGISIYISLRRCILVTVVVYSGLEYTHFYLFFKVVLHDLDYSV